MKKFKTFFRVQLFVVLAFSTLAYAGFTLSGTTIIQTGTDTDLSGLIGIAGVTKNVGQYTLDGVRLEVNGNLTMNGYVERLRFINSPTTGQNNSKAQIAVRSGATFTVEASRTINGNTVNRVLPVIDFGKFGIDFGIQSFVNLRRHLESDVGSTVNLSGVFTGNTNNNGLAYAFDGTTNLIDVYFINQGFNQGSNQQVAFARGANITINNANVVGYAYTDRGGNFLSVNGFSVAEDSEGFVWNGIIFTTPQYLAIEGYDSKQISGNHWRTSIGNAGAVGSVAELINSSVGLGLSYTNSTPADNHRLIISNRLNITPTDDSFSSIAATVYGVDIDNGNRDVNFTPSGQSLIAASGDIEYIQTGSNITFDVISGIFNPDESLDARGVSGGADLDFYAIGYLYKTATFRPILTGLGDKSVSPVLLDDTSITETDKSVVDAYTEINTLDMLYDRAKSWKVAVANIKLPTMDTQLISSNGNTLDLGDYDLVVDATASSAFDVDTTNKIITVKSTDLLSGNNFTAINTTGTVFTTNGAQIDFGYTDSSGINKYVRLNNLLAWNVNVIDNTNPSALTDILSVSAFTGDYRNHFTYSGETEILVELTYEDVVFFSEVFLQSDMNFIRSNFVLKATEENQERMLYLLEKILLHEEGISETLRSTTPNGVINVTTTTTDSEATLGNQGEIIKLIEGVIKKTTATREVLKQKE